jgi:hypothetical protein
MIGGVYRRKPGGPGPRGENVGLEEAHRIGPWITTHSADPGRPLMVPLMREIPWPRGGQSEARGAHATEAQQIEGCVVVGKPHPSHQVEVYTLRTVRALREKTSVG